MKLVKIEVRVMAEGDRSETLRFPVPDEAKYITQDSNGALWWWSGKPRIGRVLWLHKDPRTRFGCLEEGRAGTNNPRWREAIMEV